MMVKDSGDGWNSDFSDIVEREKKKKGAIPVGPTWFLSKNEQSQKQKLIFEELVLLFQEKYKGM